MERDFPQEHPEERRTPAAQDAREPREAGAAGTDGAGPAIAGPAESGPAAPDSQRPPRRRSAEERDALLAEFAGSELSAPRFAAAHDVPYSTFASWLQGEREPTRAPQPVRRFTPDERRAAVEAYDKSGRTLHDFARLWGCSASALTKWLRRYREEGPQGLETRRPPKGRRHDHPQRIPDTVRAKIVEVRKANPHFGVTRVADELARFHAVRVSPSTVRNILIEADVPRQPLPKARRKRRSEEPRRFERAHPGELWQSDITSYMLARQSRRAYLTVWLDDHSHFIVAWSLRSNMRAALVIEPLLDGIARFGKPKEVLTDQGRQYFAWRGKTAFQKLLLREGIQHVVSRAHHPETLGKCERLWETVGSEYWDRAKPEDLDDARRRFVHWVAHYNHFRPHQGIGGMVPADRFFGVERALREALERELDANQLHLALEQEPRKPVYLVGQIGDERISLHGERGRLVIETPEGGRRELRLEELGIERTKEIEDGAQRAGTAGTAGNEPESGECAEEAASEDGSQANGLREAAASGVAGAGSLGERAAGGQGASARDVHGDPGVLAGEEEQGGGGGGAGGDAAAGVAAESAGAVGDDGGPLDATSAAGGPGGVRRPSGPDAGGAEEADRGAGEGAVADGGPGAGAENGPVGAVGLGDDLEGRRSESWREAESPTRGEEGSEERSGSESERCSGREGSRGRRWWHWLRRTE